MKRLSASAKSRLPCILVVVGVLVILSGASIIVCLCRAAELVEIHQNLSSRGFRSQVKSEVEKTTKLLNLLVSTSTMNTVRVLSSSLNGSIPSSFSDIENNVAPSLFQVLSITPHLTQISYIGLEGLFFSYYTDQNQTFALYSNSSLDMHNSSSPDSPNTTYWYARTANHNTGKLYGHVLRSFPSTAVTDPSWFSEAPNSKNGSRAFLGTNWNKGQDLLFVNTARVDGNNLGLVWLGFSVEEVAKYYTDIDLQGGKSCLVTGDGKFLAGDSILSFDHSTPNVSCNSNGTLSSSLKTDERNYIFHCSQLDIIGVQSVYALAIHKSGFIDSVRRFRTITLVLLISTIAIMIALISILLPVIRRSSLREMYLSATLMKQMNATEQAERKSMNKTHAFATASHDIRASLAGMIGLIEICYDEVASKSELETNLRQLEGCTKDLSGMLTSILDTSKIEAGKMLLEEEKFDVAQLFEDVVDLYHPVGAKKGVDVILDPCDGSVSKFSHVKCDRVKLRQILSNLLSNAVKFTWEGQVVVRAWIRKPTMKNSIIESNQCTNGLTMRCLTCSCFKNKRENENNLEVGIEIVENDPNSMELVCEVDDTGKGIPKEKRNAVFENYVQVKETALGQGGTGLGLGIVQSLVRLMHGEIGIMDKDIGENGSCFRFNISLTVCENNNVSDQSTNKENHQMEDLISSPRLSPLVLTPSPSTVEGSYVVLLIQNNERRGISEKFMERLGIRVFSLKFPDQLPRTLKKIQRKRNNRSSSSNVSDFGVEIEYLSRSSASRNSATNAHDVSSFSSTAMDGADYLRSLFRKTSYNLRSSALGFVLLVVDANIGWKLPELCEAVSEFRNSLQSSCCRVVWLANPMSQSVGLLNNSKMMFDPEDIVKYKPLHGSRLYEVVRLLPEFGGPMPKRKPGGSFPINVSKSRIPSREKNDQSIYSRSEIRHEVGSSSKEKPLFGKKILVVDDTSFLRKLATYTVERLGGTVELCANGKEALELVSDGLSNNQRIKLGGSMTLPFDYILMDCEMPVMNGYDATSEIRKIETLYGVHTPIIALTAHSLGSEEATRTLKAGMDACLTKPLKAMALIDVIKHIDN